MARYSSQAVPTGAAISQKRNCTIQPAGRGRPPTISRPNAINTRLRCCPNGKVLVAGGSNHSGALASAELYDVGLGFNSLWQPEIAAALLVAGHRLRLTGSCFQGVSQASGGNNTQDSSSNYPIVPLRRIKSEQVLFAPVDPAKGWSDKSFGSLPNNRLSCRPSPDDPLYQRHSEHGEVSGG